MATGVPPTTLVHEAELSPIEVLEGLDELKRHLLVTGLAVMLVHAGADHETINDVSKLESSLDFFSERLVGPLNCT